MSSRTPPPTASKVGYLVSRLPRNGDTWGIPPEDVSTVSRPHAPTLGR